MNPLVSVITINFNNAKGLVTTLKSVVNQSYKNIQFIVVDGNSADGSKAAIETYAEYIDSITIETDSGIFNAMNKGISKANGDYLHFLNSGDYFNEATSLEKFVTHNEFKGDIIYGDYIFKEGQKIYPDVLSPAYFMRSSLPHQSTLFSKKVFEKMGNYDESYQIVSDRAFFLNCFLSEQFTFTHIQFPLVYFDLYGLSNDPEAASKKKAEDERLFKDAYQLYYPDIKRLWQLEKELAATKRDTIRGLLSRIKYKFIKRK